MESPSPYQFWDDICAGESDVQPCGPMPHIAMQEFGKTKVYFLTQSGAVLTKEELEQVSALELPFCLCLCLSFCQLNQLGLVLLPWMDMYAMPVLGT